MYFLAILHSYKNNILINIISLGIFVVPIGQAAELIHKLIHSGDPIQILLSPTNQYTPQDLLFELDNMDVTRLVRFEKSSAWIHPATLLHQGNHSVKVYRFFNNQLQLLKQYDFEVTPRADAPSQQQDSSETRGDTDQDNTHLDNTNNRNSLSMENSINASMSLLNADDTMTPEQRWTFDGSSRLNGEWKGENWTLDAQTNLFFDKNNAESDQAFMTLDDYIFNLKRGQISTQLGHHQIEESSLIVQNFNRRGLSMNWASKNKDKRFTGFMFNSRRISGFREGLGMSNKDRRIIGSALTLKPFETHPQAELSLTWLTGNNKQDYMMLDESGSAGSVGFKSQHLDERFSLEGEIAHSIFNDGMNGMGMEASKPKRDKAYRTSIEYKAIQIETEDKHQSLIFNLRHRYVGASFYSLANLGLNSDVRSHSLSMQYTKNSFSLQSSIEQQRNNVNHDPMQATVDNLQLETSIDFSPKNTQAMMMNFWGKPHFSLHLSSVQENSINLPMGATAMDKQLQSAALSADFNYETWDWNARLSYDKLKEETGHVETTHTQVLDIAINRQLSESSQVSLQWQMNKQRALGLADQKERLLIISASSALLSKKLTATGSLTWLNREQLWDSIHLHASTLEFGLNYVPQANKNKKFKQSFWLKGQYHKQDDKINGMDNRETYQISTGLTMTF